MSDQDRYYLPLLARQVARGQLTKCRPVPIQLRPLKFDWSHSPRLAMVLGGGKLRMTKDDCTLDYEDGGDRR
jgi:hypothetical protein